MLAVGKPTVVACMTGSAMDLEAANEKADAIIHCWYPGALGGRAFGRLVTGQANFSAKLPVTFYRDDNKLPDFCDYSMENRTYKFFREDPLYPFGFGLSYAKFEFSGLTLDRASVKSGETVKATVTVRNIGDRAGDEVAEFYIRDLEASTRVPRHKLCAFERVSLAPGERDGHRRYHARRHVPDRRGGRQGHRAGQVYGLGRRDPARRLQREALRRRVRLCGVLRRRIKETTGHCRYTGTRRALLSVRRVFFIRSGDRFGLSIPGNACRTKNAEKNRPARGFQAAQTRVYADAPAPRRGRECKVAHRLPLFPAACSTSGRYAGRFFVRRRRILHAFDRRRQ